MRHGLHYYRFTLPFIITFIILSGMLSAANFSIVLVSKSTSGVPGNGDSGNNSPSVSGDGRYIAFSSKASDLVAGDTNVFDDIFVYDRQAASTTRVNVSNTSVPAAGFSYNPSISANGRYVAFYSNANNLVDNDTNTGYDIFRHDRQTGTNALVSISSLGIQTDNGSYGPSISADGRYIAFYSEATNLVPNDTNGKSDVFIHDMVTGETSRVSVSSAGTQGNDESFFGSISNDGRYIAFKSYATNLVAQDTNGFEDAFVHDTVTGETTLVSLSSLGVQGNARVGFSVSISGNGRFVTFDSYASNLVPDDTNGFEDVFIHDLETDETALVSVSSLGVQGNRSSSGGFSSSIVNDDGRYVIFDSAAFNLVPDDTNAKSDVFIRDVLAGETTLVSMTNLNVLGNDHSSDPAISGDGRFGAFKSYANNLAANDTNTVRDMFVASNVLVADSPATAAPTRNHHTSLPITLTWNPVSWALDYQIQVATTNNFAAPLILDETKPNQTLSVSIPDLENREYFWHVRARKDATSWGPWSPTERFTVEIP